MSGAPSISGTAKFARPAKAGMMKTKIISAACMETRPLKVCVSMNCMPGSRELGAEEHRHEAADA